MSNALLDEQTIGFEFSNHQYVEPKRAGAWHLTAAGETWHPLEKEIIIEEIMDRGCLGIQQPVRLFSPYLSREAEDFHIARRKIREHMFRIVPWAQCWLAPDFFASMGFGGKAWSTQGITVIKSTGSANWTKSAAWHEAWHLLEYHLPHEILVELDLELDKGPHYECQQGPWSVNSERYFSLRPERRARAFERYAMLQIEGLIMPKYDWNDFAYSKNKGFLILQHAWEGGFSREAWKAREAGKGGSDGYK